MLFKVTPALIFGLIITGCPKSRKTIETDKGINERPALESKSILSLEIKNAPENFSTETELTVTVEGDGYKSLKYKISDKSEIDCYDSLNYSEEIPIGVPIDLDIADLEDGPISFCAVGKSNQGEWMEYIEAVSTTWVKKTSGPLPVASLSGQENANALSVSWTSDSEVDQNVILMVSEAPFPEEIFLEDTQEYTVDTMIGDAIKIIYKGNDTMFELDSLQVGTDYFIAVAIYDEFNFYSIPKVLTIKSFNKPFEWIQSDQNEELYQRALLSGQQVNRDGQDQNIYLCRALYEGTGLVVGQLIPLNGSLGSGTCYGVTDNGTRSVPNSDYEVLIVLRQDAVVWQKISQNNEVIVDAIEAGYLGDEVNQVKTVACRGLDNNRFRPGSASVDTGDCIFSSYNAGTISFFTDSTDHEQLVLKKAFEGQ